MAGPPIFDMIKLLFNPDISKKMILEIAFDQVKAIGYLKVLSLLLSASIVGVSSVIKIPQIKKILNPNLLDKRIAVAQGLSLEGLSLESFNYLVHVVYNKQNRNAFISYGEAGLLGLQNIAIILLIEYYNKRKQLEVSSLSESEKKAEALKSLVRPAAIIVGLIVVLDKLAPAPVVSALQLLSIPLSIVSKLPQIRKNHVLKSTAHLSNVTVGANVLGAASRVFTTANDKRLSKDPILLAGYLASFALNAYLAGQCYFYGRVER